LEVIEDDSYTDITISPPLLIKQGSRQNVKEEGRNDGLKALDLKIRSHDVK
jgi:hypothetical protein